MNNTEIVLINEIFNAIERYYEQEEIQLFIGEILIPYFGISITIFVYVICFSISIITMIVLIVKPVISLLWKIVDLIRRLVVVTGLGFGSAVGGWLLIDGSIVRNVSKEFSEIPNNIFAANGWFLLFGLGLLSVSYAHYYLHRPLSGKPIQFPWNLEDLASGNELLEEIETDSSKND